MRAALLTLLCVLLGASSAQAHQLRVDSSVRPADRARLDAALAAGRPQAQAIISGLRARVLVAPGRGGSSASCYTDGGGCTLVYSTMHLRGPLRDHVVWHELGHLLQFTAMARAAPSLFADQELRDWRRGCGRRCPGVGEAFAEHFTYWARPGVPYRSPVYHIPRMALRAEIGTYVQTWKIR